MEWIETRPDDAIFESMLSPLVRQLLEKLFLSGDSPERTEGVQKGFFVFHRELGLLLQNAASQALFPKILPGAGWEALVDLLERALIPASRSEFRERVSEDIPSFSGAWRLLPDRISQSSGLFLWGVRFEWGRAVFLRGESDGSSSQALAGFAQKVGKIEALLRPVLDRWMLDSTLEVFWGRILGNIPEPFVPLGRSQAPEWRRAVPLPALGGEVEDEILDGDYWKVPGEGWTRRVLKLEKRKEAPGSAGARTGAGEAGACLEVPVDLWGIFNLGTVRFPAGIVRNFDIPHFLSKLRHARALSLRSLYRHLLYPGQISFLSFWLPEDECFDPDLLKELPSLGPPSTMEDALATILLPSGGYLKRIEEKLRPADLLFQDPKKPGRIYLYLRGCPPERAKASVFPRLLRIEGMAESNLEGAGSLREFLAARGISPADRKATTS